MGKVLYCNLKEILDQKSISVLKFSEDINHRRATIHDLYHNNNMNNKRIPAKLIVDICNYLNISIDELFSIVDE